MTNAPIVIHSPNPSGGRLVTVHINGREERLGIAHNDQELIAFLADAGLEDPERVLDSRALITWEGTAAHRYTAA
ncbi:MULTISPECIES: hypothetical protein [unclassified Streptomyces]|uniref:hypothetical protein n=1 Tax=unclassified Streptomyces TaxID=2593676 RepID=UPI0033BDB2FA